MRFSQEVSVFQGRNLPETGSIVGYAAIIDALRLPVPIPDTISVISRKNKKYEVPGWSIFTPKYRPDETLYKQLVFALKYEGVNLLVFKKLFEQIAVNEITDMLKIEPTGQYSRKIWFLYEWLSDTQLEIADADSKMKFTPLLDEEKQFSIKGTTSSRHKIINNLPGTIDFCPLIFKTEKLKENISGDLQKQKNALLKSVHKDIIQRASSFLLLKDSQASFTIEGENPANNRAIRWGKAIGQAGSKPLSKEELIRLQQIVIENTRFIKMGFRTEGGFIGGHDRITGEPIPDHISAKWQDVEKLINGLLQTNKLLEKNFDAVLAAAISAFGFVFIHPFADGNGRIHRYIIHHILATNEFAPQGVVFPVSASILDNIDVYRKTLENYSHPLLDFIQWKATERNNVEVLNDTIDYYRYYDATKQAEFLYDCVKDTITRVIPEEINYLINYDEFKKHIDNQYEMPDAMVASLVRFLQQNDGKLSKRAKQKEFNLLSEKEIEDIEMVYNEIFLQNY